MKKGLGKGLGALISYSADPEAEMPRGDEDIFDMDINKVFPNPGQPRKRFEESYIDELAESIKEYGIIQPLIVKGTDKGYIIVAGERRWRAAKKAGLLSIPIIVREYSNIQTLEIALIENIQRENLNPIEEADCYKRLNEEFSLTQEEISKKVGKSRSHIANSMRLLKLDARVREFVAAGELTAGHAKAILPVEDGEIQHYFAMKIVEEKMSVREAEEFVKEYTTPLTDEEREELSKPVEKDNKKYGHFQMELRGILSTRVNIRDNKTGGGGGKIEINYFSEDDLNRIVDVIKRSR